MGSLSQLLGDYFFNHLEASAEEASHSVRLLTGMGRDASVDLQGFLHVREKAKEIASKIERALAHNVMANLKREDIVALSTALCLIPEAVERFAGRWMLAQGNVNQLDFTPLFKTLNHSAETVVKMVQNLGIFDNEAAAKQLHVDLQQSDDATEALGEKMIEALHRRELEPVTLLMVEDVINHAIAVSSACGECGDLLEEIVLKYG